jgi:predicted TIM-barrel fold metal-dependent hydrolase
MVSYARDIVVLDANHRLGGMSFGSMQEWDDSYMIGAEAHERRLRSMAEIGVDAALIMPVQRYLRPNGAVDTSAVNDNVARYRDADRRHIPAALGIAEPLHGAAGVDEIVRMDEELGFVGAFYNNNWQGVPVSDPLMYRQLEELQQRRMLPFIHCYAESMMAAPAMIADVAERFPELPIVLVDCWTGIIQFNQLMLDAARFPNLYFETSTTVSWEMLKRFAERHGAHRLIFGSDTYSHKRASTNSPQLIRDVLGEESTLVLRDNIIGLLEWTGRPVFAEASS